MLSPEQQSRMSYLRSKVIDGTITMEEMRETVLTMREGRITTAQAAQSTKAKKSPRSADDLLSELGGL